MVALHPPVVITPSLMAGLDVVKGESWVAVEPCEGLADEYGKPCWRYQVVAPGIEHEGNDLRGWGDHREMLRSLLDFLLAAVESYRYGTMAGREKGENEDLFPGSVVEWAYENDDRLQYLRLELEDVELGS